MYKLFKYLFGQASMLYKRLKDKIITHKIKKRFPTSNVNIKCSFDNKTILEGFNVLNYMSNVCSSKIGFCSVVGQKSILTNCSIGRFCSIAANVCVVDATHPLNFVSTYPSFFNTSNDYPFKKGETFFNEFS